MATKIKTATAVPTSMLALALVLEPAELVSGRGEETTGWGGFADGLIVAEPDGDDCMVGASVVVAADVWGKDFVEKEDIVVTCKPKVKVKDRQLINLPRKSPRLDYFKFVTILSPLTSQLAHELGKNRKW
jgi:hypothetical protein